ncbi:hypothetical protein EON63_03640, partial [archaeon]
MPTPLTDLILSLLTLDPATRISNNCSLSTSPSDASVLKGLTYDKMRERRFFTEAWESGESMKGMGMGMPSPQFSTHDGTNPYPPTPPST